MQSFRAREGTSPRHHARSSGPGSPAWSTTTGGTTTGGVTISGSTEGGNPEDGHQVVLDLTPRAGYSTSWDAEFHSLDHQRTERFTHYGTAGSGIRLPAGDWALELVVGHNIPQGGPVIRDVFLVPQISVDGDTTLAFDPADTLPVTLGVAGVTSYVGGQLTWSLAGNGGIEYRSAHRVVLGSQLRTLQVGAVPEGWSLTTHVFGAEVARGAWWGVAAGPLDGLPNGFDHQADPADMAQVSLSVGANRPGDSRVSGDYRYPQDYGSVLLVPDTLPPGAGEPGIRDIPLPLDETVWLEDGVSWEIALSTVPSLIDDSKEIRVTTGFRDYAPGTEHTVSLNHAVLGPELGASQGIFRTGDRIHGSLPPLTDAHGHTVVSTPGTSEVRLYRDGVLYGAAGDPSGFSFTVPDGPADYLLVVSVDRSGGTTWLSTDVTARHQFRSARPAGAATVPVPASAVRFVPEQEHPANSVTPGSELTLPLEIQGTNGRLTVEVSYTDGVIWRASRTAAPTARTRRSPPGSPPPGRRASRRPRRPAPRPRCRTPHGAPRRRSPVRGAPAPRSPPVRPPGRP